MLPRCRWLCSLPLLALTLLAVAAPARGADGLASVGDVPSKLIDVKEQSEPTTLAFHDPTTNDPTWTFVWSDLGVTDNDAPYAGAARGIEPFFRANNRPPRAPQVIAAPLPPALLPGLIGLAGVYLYKRRNRLR